MLSIFRFFTVEAQQRFILPLNFLLISQFASCHPQTLFPSRLQFFRSTIPGTIEGANSAQGASLSSGKHFPHPTSSIQDQSQAFFRRGSTLDSSTWNREVPFREHNLISDLVTGWNSHMHQDIIRGAVEDKIAFTEGRQKDYVAKRKEKRDIERMRHLNNAKEVGKKFPKMKKKSPAIPINPNEYTFEHVITSTERLHQMHADNVTSDFARSSLTQNQRQKKDALDYFSNGMGDNMNLFEKFDAMSVGEFRGVQIAKPIDVVAMSEARDSGSHHGSLVLSLHNLSQTSTAIDALAISSSAIKDMGWHAARAPEARRTEDTLDKIIGSHVASVNSLANSSHSTATKALPRIIENQRPESQKHEAGQINDDKRFANEKLKKDGAKQTFFKNEVLPTLSIEKESGLITVDNADLLDEDASLNLTIFGQKNVFIPISTTGAVIHEAFENATWHTLSSIENSFPSYSPIDEYSVGIAQLLLGKINNATVKIQPHVPFPVHGQRIDFKEAEKSLVATDPRLLEKESFGDIPPPLMPREDRPGSFQSDSLDLNDRVVVFSDRSNTVIDISVDNGSIIKTTEVNSNSSAMDNHLELIGISHSLPNVVSTEIGGLSAFDDVLPGMSRFREVEGSYRRSSDEQFAAKETVVNDPSLAKTKIRKESNSEIFTPTGWFAMGPICVTIAHTPPYTKCSDYKSTFEPSAISQMQVVEPGVCQILIKSGVNLVCPPGFSMNLTMEIDKGMKRKIYRCLRTNFTEAKELIAHEACPLGFDPMPEGCIAKQQSVEPEFVCPKSKKLGAEPINDFSFRKKMYIHCIENLQYKGRLICPDGFLLYNEPYPDLLFGDLIPPNLPRTAWKNGLDLSFWDYKPGSFPSPADFLYEAEKEVYKEAIATYATCIEILAVDHNSCTPFDCHSPAIKNTKKVIKNWSFYRLYENPEIALKESIPTGSDLRYSIPAFRKPVHY